MSNRTRSIADLSPAQLAALQARLRALRGEAVVDTGIPRRAGTVPVPLSFAQQRLWFVDRLEPESAAYNTPSALRLLGRLDRGVLARSLDEVVRRHETLRTSFPLVDGEPVQAVAPAAPRALPLVDLAGLPAEAREREARRLVHDEARRPFDLAHGPLLRVTLLRLGAAEHMALFTVHHVISDAWSTRVLVSELSALYDAFSRGAPSPLPELPVQYADYTLWQRERVSGALLDEQLAFWRGVLDGAPPVLELPTDRPRTPWPDPAGATATFVLPASLGRALSEVGHRKGATLFMTMMAAWQVLLGRWSGQDDVVVGTPIANRTRHEVEGIIGLFANTLALRGDLSGDPTFLELLGRVRETTLGAHSHQDLPFERLVQALDVDRNAASSPLFQAMLVFGSLHGDEMPRMGDVRVEPVEIATGSAMFDLLLTMSEQAGVIGGVLEYRTSLWDAATIDRLLGHYRMLLEAIAADPARRISALPLLTPDERARVVDGWNATEAAYPSEACIHDLFGEAAARTPDAPAVAWADGTLSYAELDARANRLARHLRRAGVGPDARVGICLPRGPEMMIAVLGVMKAGAACVPVDPAYPADRIAYMLADSAAPVLITDRALADGLPATGARLVLVDADADMIAAESAEPIPSGAHPDGLAYVIYTSGSTGRPKGVAMPHRPIVNLLAWQAAEWRHPSASTTLQFTTLSFDVSFQEIFSCWHSGGRLVLVGEDERRDLGAVLRRLDEERIERLFLPYVALQHVAELAEEHGIVPRALREVQTAGEQLRVTEPIRRFFVRTGATLSNQYGPSETHVATALTLAGEPDAWPLLPPIGGPVANARCYVLDGAGEPTPIGVPGELYLAGACLARGYLGRPALTAERFVPDAFGTAGARAYRTGDRARWRMDGTLEFLGRADDQVKVRGFRIELGEVEAALESHASVREAVVIVREDAPGDRRLVGYVVAAAGAPSSDLPSVSALRAHVAERLPEYMVPSALVVLDAFPLTPSGKVARRALPAPDASAAAETDAYVAPRTATEEILAGIFAEVLRIDRVGARDDFFALGGHSLIATRVVSRIRDLLGVDLPLRALFDGPRVEALAAQVDGLLRRARGTSAPPLVPVERDGPLPLSFAQQRLWFIDQLEPGSAAYNMPAALRIRGALDTDALRRALDEIVARHESLRTRFAGAGGEPVQTIEGVASAALAEVDLRALPEDAREREVRALAAAEAARPFDLAAGPLLRSTLLRLGADDHALLFTMHHVVSDGWSLGVLVREVTALYDAFARGAPSPLAPLPVQYADYAVWQRAWLTGEVLDAQLGYWRGKLDGAPPVLELPTDHPRPAVPGSRGATYDFSLPDETARALRALCRESGATLYMGLLTGLQLLLGRYAGTDDLVIGSPVANRTRLETEGLIGFFANTLALRGDLFGDPTVRALLGRVRETVLEAQAHQDLPFERLVEELAPERSLQHAPLFQVLFVLQDADSWSLRMGDAALEIIPPEAEIAKFDLQLTLVEEGGRVHGRFSYRTELWDTGTMERAAEHLRRLLAGMAAGPDRPISALDLLPESERALVLRGWNATEADYARDGTVHALFEAQADRTPDATAVIPRDGEPLSYAALESRANRLAHHLVGLGVRPDDRVGLCLERGPEMMAAVLGILKAGAAYVPLDPAYPAERLAYMLENSAARVLLTQSSLADALPASGATVLRVDADGAEIGRASADRPRVAVSADHLSYVIYTSGSTGRPKGVALHHRPLANLLAWQEGDWRGPAAAVTLQFTTISFDVSFHEMFSAWMSGGCVVLIDEALRYDPAGLLDVMEREGVERIFMPAIALQQVAEVADARGLVPSRLREVQTAGEQLRVTEPLRRWMAALGAPLHNHYGPSETHVVTSLSLEGDPAAWPLLPGIGRPIANTRCYVLDAALRPTPIGIPGELYLGGDNVARGYLGRPALTAERFLPDPFASGGARVYRTGDRARWMADGNIEFLGRTDEQVKIRGFRIEPGEVEAVLAAHDGVREAVVIVREDAPGDRRLVGYVVAADASAVTPAELRAHLKARMPEYMVPSAVVVLDAIPLTPSGKVARRALPAPEGGEGERYVAPRTAAEEILAGIFADVLRVDRVGAGDDFFALGGHSLLATRVVSRIGSAFGTDVPVRALFEAPTVAALAARVEALRAAGGGVQAPPVVPVPRGAPLPLSFAQQRLWFIDQLEPGSAAYNLPYALRLRGNLDADALRRALDGLVRRHESLRTRFPADAGEPVQVIDPPRPVPLPLADLGPDHLDDHGARESALRVLAAAEAARPFDLAAGPLLRCTLVRLADDEHALLFTMHHVVSDGWSMAILTREISELYGAAIEGREPILSPLPVQYADFAAWQRRWLTGDVLDAQLAWWRDRLADAPPLLELPTDRPRPAVQGGAGAHLPFALADDTLGALRTLSRGEGATLFMTLLAAWQLLLSRYAGQSDVLVGTPVAGRTRLETEGLIGFFVNTQVVRTDLSGDPSFRALLGRVREGTLSAYGHQDIPFEKLVEELAPERSLGHTPFFQTLFVLQNNVREALRLGDLQAEALPVGDDAAKFDLTFTLSEEDDGLQGALSYRTELWDADTIGRMLGHFGALLRAVAADASRPIGEYPLLGDDERGMLAAWNATDRAYPAGPVHALFAAQAARTPHAPALVFGGEATTYAELHARANRLANHLRRLGVGAETRVGVCLERTPEMIVALLAVLTAGAAYVPLDPAYPRERLGWMIEDAGARWVLTTADLADRLPASAEAIRIDALRDRIGAESAGAPRVDVDPENLSHVIFTSGSTGRPKGVMIRHSSTAILLHWMRENVSDDERASVLGSTSINFDVSVAEIFGTLCWGGTLVLVENALALPEVADQGIRYASMVPTAAAELLRTGGIPSTVRTLFLGGEPLPNDLAQALYETGIVVKVGNLYGPTEDTTYSTYSVVPRGADRVLVGRPLANTRAHVLDAGLRPVPVGIAGELYLAGGGVSRGYAARPGMTAERFLPDPSGPAGSRMYRVMDRVRWTASGELEYFGRTDFQVKVRGFRIELGEIETALRAHPSIHDAVALVREDAPGGRRIVAYFVSADGDAVPAAELRAYVKERLPEYMVPSAFVALDALPQTPNGKLDRRALPAPDAPAADADRYVEPRTREEALVARIWAEVLGVERVGAHDDFFALGGHSLLATRVLSRLRTAGVELPLRVLFERSTVASLAERVAHAGMDAAPLALPILLPADGALPLSFAQERLWFIQQLQPESAVYNLQFALRLRGPLDTDALGRALDVLVQRHESLRTRFPSVDGEPAQVVDAARPVPLARADLAGVGDAAEREAALHALNAAEAARPFDLANGPLLRCTLARLGEGEHAMLFTLHHIVCDGWSMAILASEVSALYGAFSEGGDASLAPLPVQYAGFAAWQREWLASDAVQSQMGYWRERLAGVPPLELPTDRPRPAVQGHRGGSEPLTLSVAASDALRRLSRAEGATVFMTLLAALQLLLSRLSGQDDFAIGSPIAGRTRAETEGLIGFFLNNLVLRADLGGDPTFRELLGRVRETTLGAFAHQEIPFERLIEELRPPRDPARTPFFQVLVNMLPADDGGRVRFGGAMAEPLDRPEPESKFDLALNVVDGDALRLALIYNRDLFDADTARRILGWYEVLLESAVAGPDRRISTLPLLRDEERAALARDAAGRGPAVPFAPLPEWDADDSIASRFAAQVRATPDGVAVETDSYRWTYAELDARANGVAHALLRACGADPGRVALFLDHEAPMVAGVLGALKAGKTYVPLDIAFPAERVRRIVADVEPAALLTEATHADAVRALAGTLPVLVMEDAAAEPVHGVDCTVSPDAAAYILYTSGSTGEPKGVVQSHGNVLRHIRTYAGRLGVRPGDRLSLFSGYGFDAAVMDLYAALLTGATLCPIGLRGPAAADLPAAVLRRGVTVFHATPTVYRHLAAQLRPEHDLSRIRAVVLGGEAVVPADLEAFRAHFPPDALFVNGMGPTECTVALQYYADARTPAGGAVPVGFAVDDIEVRLLNAAGEPVETLATGEITVRGAHVALGYWRRPELTSAAFLPDPEGDARRIYRTGDFGRLLPDGAIAFAGRRDGQVKVRGFRVETGEVESVLRRHAGVAECAVVPVADAGETRLVAYVVGDADADALRAWVRGALPEHMVPAAFVSLESLPLTPNGKLDRRALPAADVSAAAAEYVAPRTEAERVVAEIWARVLGVEQVGVHDDFFALGGHSLRATRVVSHVARTLGADVPLRTLFESPTLGGFVDGIARSASLAGGGGGRGAGVSAGSALSAVATRDGAQAVLDEVDALSEEEMDRLLRELSTDEEDEW
jgi:amino acid adenylation domain-containing protein